MNSIDPVEIQVITTIVVMVANLLLVLLTGAYVILTRQTVMEMKASRDPSVFFDLEFPNYNVRGVIGNSGQSAALNVKFRVRDSHIPWLIKSDTSSRLQSLKPIKNGISFLPPNRTLMYRLNMIDWEQLNTENTLLSIEVNYENETGKKFSREYFIDVSQYYGISYETYRDSNMEVANAIRSAERSRQSQVSVPYRIIPPGTKACTMCAEFIPTSAKKCSHCGELFGEKSPSSSGKKNTRSK